MTSNTGVFNPFRIYKNNTTSTEYVQVDVSALDTARTLTMPNSNVDMQYVPNQSVATTGTPQFTRVGINKASASDALEVKGNISIWESGGTYKSQLLQPTLAASRTVSLPDASINVPIVRYINSTSSGTTKTVLTITMTNDSMCLVRIEAIAIDTANYTPEAFISYRTIKGTTDAAVTETSIIDESTHTSWTIDKNTNLTYKVNVVASRTYGMKVTVQVIAGDIPTITLA